ncbi:betaine/proline/choline family ABC transporter ATP-binding protein [Saccharopolyspora sp. HNM0983]|uniref:Betaine/proline/choline family ABC transporter ATP-binding protein n=1 Tax=Saccharopolyspora montiporae TaxID=2781240 RepID=A0A929G059_9PSEU|nr:betaine/proline/choline family ABC transporter ATP-binding protein [Saccharopolyspora sp. HNM0983]MBE9375260.1 betaine/proline/choline family ABC transporter ATP-binding protein [Saccharopolyspora sp. HNM0983]
MLQAMNVTKVFGLPPGRARDLLRGGGGDHRAAVIGAGGVMAVDDVSFDVERGEIFVIMGLSGSGKSTLIRMVNRLVDSTAGEIRFDGEDIAAMNRTQLRELRNRRFSMVFQHFALFPHRSIRDNAAYGLKTRGVARGARLEQADRALEQVGLHTWGDARPDELSGGMQQRVGLARALATDPDVLIMDEPFSALDPLNRRAMQEQLLDLQTRLGKTILFVTHDLNEAMRIGDRIMVMRSGSAVQLGRGAEIISEPADDYVREFIADVDRTRALTAGAVMTEPAVTADPGETGADVRERLRRAGTPAAYVLDEQRRITGVLHAADLGAHERPAAELADQEYARVPVTAPLADFCHLAGRHSAPVAVVDDERRLRGVVERAALLDAIASPTEEAARA